MKIHLVAVAGTGMGALAGLLVALGHEVTGSDVAFDPPIGPELERWGVRCLRGFDPAHLDPAPDLVVVGNVCRKDNPEAVAAFARGLRVTDMAHAVADLAMGGAAPLVVAGTHGKTTTSALAAFLLSEAGLEPGFLIGGIPKNFGAGFRPAGRARVGADGFAAAQRSKGKTLPLLDPAKGAAEAIRRTPFVIEGDEYDTAFFEKTPKFWHYRPEVAIVTSIEHDHVDIYPDEESYLAAFRELVRRVPEDGLIVAAAADPRVRAIVAGARARVTWFALEGDDTGGVAAEWTAAAGAVVDGFQQFDAFAGGMSCGRLAMRIPGAHNVRNAIATIAACAEGYGVPIATLSAALPRFEGVRRRQDLLGAPRGVLVYDDFAHHPTAVEETLLALRRKHPDGRLFAVFEPRSATACRSLHQEPYARAFAAADRVILAPLGRTNVPEGERLDLDRLVADLRAAGKPADRAPSVDAIVAAIVAEARAGDTVALLSNGAFGGIHGRLLAALER